MRGWHYPQGNSPEAIAARDRNDLNATYTMADAVFSAGFLNACLRHSDTVGMANMAPVVNTRGPLFVHPDGVVKRPTFHVLCMYANLLEANVVDTWISCVPLECVGKSVPAVDAVATCDDSMQAWSVALVNRHAETPATCYIYLGGRPLDGRWSMTTLCGDSPDAYNDLTHPDRVTPIATEVMIECGVITLPPHTVSVIRRRV